MSLLPKSLLFPLSVLEDKCILSDLKSFLLIYQIKGKKGSLWVPWAPLGTSSMPTAVLGAVWTHRGGQGSGERASLRR